MLQSFKKNRLGILCMLASSVCVCLGQLFWKLSAAENVGLLLTGFFLYTCGAIVMLVAYRFGSLSVLQPMLSMNYIFTIFLAHYVLGELITPLKLLGILIISISVVLIGGGDD